MELFRSCVTVCMFSLYNLFAWGVNYFAVTYLPKPTKVLDITRASCKFLLLAVEKRKRFFESLFHYLWLFEIASLQFKCEIYFHFQLLKLCTKYVLINRLKVCTWRMIYFCINKNKTTAILIIRNNSSNTWKIQYFLNFFTLLINWHKNVLWFWCQQNSPYCFLGYLGALGNAKLN